MMKLVMHIGSHKAGSTSIQDYCFHNQDHLIQNNILYPLGLFGRYPRQHSELRLMIAQNDTEALRRFFESIITDAINRQASTVFLSGEDLCILSPALVNRLYSVIKWTSIFDTIDIVLLLRNKRDYLMSQYKHNLLYGTPIDQMSFLSTHSFSPRACVDAWTHFRDINVKVCSFEKMKHDLLNIFFRLALDIDVHENITSNEAQDYLMLQIVNAFLKPYPTNDIINILIRVNREYSNRVMFPIEQIVARNLDTQYSNDDWQVQDFLDDPTILETKDGEHKDPDPLYICRKMQSFFTKLVDYFESHTPNVRVHSEHADNVSTFVDAGVEGKVTPKDFPTGAFLRDLASDESIEQIARLVDTATHRRSDFFVSDPVDCQIAKYGRYFTEPLTEYKSHAVYLYRINEATLISTDGVILHQNLPIRDTVRHLSTWLPDSAVASYVHHGELHLKNNLPIRDPLVPAFIGYNGGWRNYAHWMQECVPKILVWRRLRDQMGNAKLALPAVEPTSFHAQTLQILGIDINDVLVVQSNEAIALKNAFFTNDLDLFNISSTVADVGRVLSPCAPRYKGNGARIYIHRDVPLRRLENFDTIVPVLQQHGFVIVTFEDVCLSQQVSIMQEARYIIAEHGAGLINVVFCEPGARVLELFNPMCVQPAFWSVASVCGHHYGYLVGSHVPTAFRPNLDWNSSYAITPERLDAAISDMIVFNDAKERQIPV